MGNPMYYVVFVGRRPGVYTSWPDCQAQVIGYKGNAYKSYKSLQEAERAWALYPPRWIKPEQTVVPTENEFEDSGSVQNYEPDGRRNIKEGFNLITAFCMGCIVMFLLMWTMQLLK